MPSQTPTRLRSWLFTPATRPERFAKAAEVGADALIIDLEDAVAPKDKDNARVAALEYLVRPGQGGPARVLRINGLDTPPGLADLAALLGSPASPDFVLLPKTDSAGHLQILDRLLKGAKKDIRLIGIIESASGLASVEMIATATPRLAALAVGGADLAADLGATVAWEPLLSARSRVVAACALGGILPVDSPFFDLHDTNGLKQELQRSIALGFAGKLAIHPAQVGPINAALTPSDAEVDKARAILVENSKGVGVVHGQMIDEAVARNARRILAAAGATEN
jgi:(S)-citramalyl-CoA lyase